MTAPVESQPPMTPARVRLLRQRFLEASQEADVAAGTASGPGRWLRAKRAGERLADALADLAGFSRTCDLCEQPVKNHPITVAGRPVWACGACKESLRAAGVEIILWRESA